MKHLATPDGINELKPPVLTQSDQIRSSSEKPFYLDGTSSPYQYLIVIEPDRSRMEIGLGDLWNYRELFYFLMLRELQVRYAQTLLGVTWVILRPLSTMLIAWVIFGILAGIPADGIPYPLFHYAGLSLWFFFAQAVTDSKDSLVGNAHLITKVYFPRLTLPLAIVGGRLVDFAITFIPLVGMVFWYRVPLTTNILLLPALIVLTAILATSLGIGLAALNVKYRDAGHIVPVLIQLMMLASPVIYSSRLLPAKWQQIYNFNPLVGILESYRASLFGRQFDWLALGISTVVTLLLFIFALYIFRWMEDDFADII